MRHVQPGGDGDHRAHRWPRSQEETIQLQHRLAGARPPPWHPAAGVPLIGACYVCFARGRPGRGEEGESAWAAAALCRGTRFEMAVAVEGRAGAAYVPGLMAAREGPVLQSAVEALPRPDVLIVNATGRDHPRRAGLAVHLGAVLDLPSVGVTDRCLTAEGGAPGLQRWSASPMTIGDEEVAAALRTRASARPVIVHPGWATELSTALLVVRLATRRARTPEPLRRARRLARLVRAGRAGAGEVLVRGEL